MTCKECSEKHKVRRLIADLQYLNGEIGAAALRASGHLYTPSNPKSLEPDCSAMEAIAIAASAAKATQLLVLNAAQAAYDTATDLDNAAWNDYLANCGGEI